MSVGNQKATLHIDKTVSTTVVSMELSGKVSIITGASSGLGQAMAVIFARKGAMITLCGRDRERLKVVLTQCTQASGGHQERFVTVHGDITEACIRQEIVDKTIQTFRCLDILVANAGTLLPGTDIEGATEEAFDIIFNTNVKSIFFLIQLALPRLEKSRGNIVSISSIISSTVRRGLALYAMSKAAVDHMTRCLALNLAPRGIRVNAVKPSYVRTNITRNLAAESTSRISEHEKAMQPTSELGTGDDIAETVSFLASDTAKFITGQCLPVDGGRGLVGA